MKNIVTKLTKKPKNEKKLSLNSDDKLIFEFFSHFFKKEKSANKIFSYFVDTLTETTINVVSG